MAEGDSTDDLVAVYVPRQHLQIVYEMLGRLMSDGAAPEPLDDTVRVHVDNEQGYWSDAEVTELADRVDGTELMRVLSLIAQVAPSWISFSEVMQLLEIERDALRAQLATLTKYCRSITGRKTWPFSAAQRGDEMSYSMPEVVADWWQQAALVLLELHERSEAEWRTPDVVVPRPHTGRKLVGPSRVSTLRRSDMSTRNERHVTPRDDGRWEVVSPGSQKPSAVTDTQADAINRAREIVHKAGGGEVVIHGRDGRIRDSDTIAPGNDPNPPRDRK